ncbi:hypothetical protein NKG94_06475 [Micromonospora sp. M12]
MIRAQDAEFLGAGSDTIALLADSSATGGLLGVSRTTLGQGRNGATRTITAARPRCSSSWTGGYRSWRATRWWRSGRRHPRGPAAHRPRLRGRSRLSCRRADRDHPGVERFDYFRLLDRVRHGHADPRNCWRSRTASTPTSSTAPLAPDPRSRLTTPTRTGRPHADGRTTSREGRFRRRAPAGSAW